MKSLLLFLLLLSAFETFSSQPNKSVPWSRMPPGNLNPRNVPQFVSITFDDNFGLAHPEAKGGMPYIVDFYKGKKNYDGSPIQATFFHTSIYLVDESEKVVGGKQGEDRNQRNRSAWSAAFSAGHEAAVHTVNHFNGGVAPLSEDDCCRPRNWEEQEWIAEIQSCKESLSSSSKGIGARPGDVFGFRAPYLAFNDPLFGALRALDFKYDSSLPNCFDDSEDGRNCSWPYTLDAGSPDVVHIAKKFPALKIPGVTSHQGLWEVPPTTLIIPPDELATQYKFSSGLRTRVSKRIPMSYPSLYEPSTGKIAGLDYTLLIDAGLSGSEMSAVLKYNLDLHINGNRAPLVFVAHSHLYTYSTPEDNPDTPSVAEREERWKGITEFLEYAIHKPEVRVVAIRDLLAWIDAKI